MNTLNTTLAFIGAGNMASAIIGGLVNNGFDPKCIYASDPFSETLERLADTYGVHTSEDNSQAISHADVVILAVKPQLMHEVCGQIQESILKRNPLVISIAAGITCEHLQNWLSPNLAIVRAMPNTPALVKTGATGVAANMQVTKEQQEIANTLLQAFGMVEWVDNETLLDAVTALSGSGPAYFFLLMEAMQAAGEALGLSPDVARNLTLQTALGAAKMASQGDVDPAELRRRVTSPNGTTEAAINNFQSNKFADIVKQAMTAADERSKSLAVEMNR